MTDYTTKAFCQCGALTAAVIEKEAEVAHAREKLLEYKIALAAQLLYKKYLWDSLVAIFRWYLPSFSIKDISIRVIKTTLAKAAMKKFLSAGLNALIAAAKVAAIQAAAVGLYSTIAMSLTFEEHYRHMRDMWSKNLRVADKELKALEKLRDDCWSNTKICAECGEPFTTTVSGCIKKCSGCERWYCINCFDPEIEKWELEKKKK